MVTFTKVKQKTFKLFSKIKVHRKGYQILKDELEMQEEKNIPQVPIKTYQWEDVRRSRKIGAYPWTHLTKPPFNEEFVAEEFTMDTLKFSKDTSTLGKLDTQELSEVKDNTVKISEEQVTENKENVEKASTSKGILKTTTLKPLNNGNGTRAKSEEPKRKRKLSAESSYSRISQSKLGLVDKLKNAKNKLLKRSKSDASELKHTKQKPGVKIAQETSKPSRLTTVKDESPVYIHIPLKPPPGESDEFSNLEFESPAHSHSGSLVNLPKTVERKMSLLEILTQIKLVHEQHEKAKKPPQFNTELVKRVKLHADDEYDTKGIPSTDLENPSDKENDALTIEEIQEDENKSNKSMEDSKPESERTHSPKITEPEDSSADDNISQYLDKDDKCEISEKSTNVSSDNISQSPPNQSEDVKPDPESARKMEATLFKWQMYLPPPSPLDPPVHYEIPIRAKSEEPKRRRRPSLESSYSRKSLSKLNFMKKIKQARSKLKLPKFPSFSKVSRKNSKKSKAPIKVEQKQPSTENPLKLSPQSLQTPVYIHIPLKPPAGQTDEFSHLENAKIETSNIPEELPSKTEDTNEPEAQPEPESDRTGVQLIILTPPSEDGILDNSTSEFAPESKKTITDNSKIDDLKSLAKTAVDSIYPEPQAAEDVNVEESEENNKIRDTQEATIQNEDEESEQTTPDPESSHSNVQLIILTPPSDDEILDDGVPETPSETDDKYFEDYRSLAKTAIDKVCSTEKLDSIVEDLKGSNASISMPKEDEEVTTKTNQKQLQILVDEEDGLKLSETAIAMINEEMEKELQQQAREEEKSESPILIKKKVSFKRRSKTIDGERIYEDVELNTNSGVKSEPIPLETFHSMSVDEEKSYLDKQVIKSTSLEDDYNKWSKLNDHEYEPINPPPEEERGHTADKYIVPGNQFVKSSPNEVFDDDEGYVAGYNLEDSGTAQKMQQDIENRFFNAPHKSIPKTGYERSTIQEQSSTKTSTRSSSTPKIEEPVKSFNETLRIQANKLKSKLKNIKKPNFTLPQRPKFPSTKLKKPNFKKPNFNMPKMPKAPSFNLPSFNLTRKSDSKDSWRKRQFSTESNVGDSKKKIFDFRTYPRMFEKSNKNDDHEETPPPPEFATVPRPNRKPGPVGSRWANKFKDIAYVDDEKRKSKEIVNEKTSDTIRIPLHSENSMDMPAPLQNEDIDIEDDFDQEIEDDNIAPEINEEHLKRWKHGEFHEVPLTKADEYPEVTYNDDYKVLNANNGIDDMHIPEGNGFDKEVIHGKEEHSSGSSEHHRGVLEEIDSDEFFLREKGISQDNIEVGKYLSSEIREAFRNPINALAQLQNEDRAYDPEMSDQSEPIQNSSRRKPLKKPKRKKTPHVSKEELSFDRDSVNTEPEEYSKSFQDFKTYTPPTRPKRKSKRAKKKMQTLENVIPYQETIPIQEQMQSFIPPEYIFEVEGSEILPDNILGDDSMFFDNRFLQQIYENEHMKGIEQPEIKISDAYYRYENFEDILPDEAPMVPPRRLRSSKSLSVSEQGSHLEDLNLGMEDNLPEMEAYPDDREYIIPTPEPPCKPKRIRSRTRSHSGISQQEDDKTSRGADSSIFDTQIEVIEDTCMQNVHDVSGYAVIDKSKTKEPSIPSTPPRPRRAKKSKSKFATAPRPLHIDPPVRPLRNYSTLGDPKKSRSSRSITPSLDDDEKENIDTVKLNENDDDPARRLQSGEVIQKMKDRPLPAPPRPPRRPRSTRDILRDISHERNIPEDFQSMEKLQFDEDDKEFLDQTFRSSLLTDILSDIGQQVEPCDHEETITHGTLVVQPINNTQFLSYSRFSNVDQDVPEHTPIERIIQIIQDEKQESENLSTTEEPEGITLSETEKQLHEESNELQIMKEVEQTVDENVSEKEHIVEKEAQKEIEKSIPKLEEDDYDETSEIPEEFTQLKNPETVTAVTEQHQELKPINLPKPPPRQEKVRKSIDRVSEPLLQGTQEIEVLKAQKLQVVDLDVDKLRVNELQASKIIVSELDGVSLQVSEINSKSGNLIVSGIELPQQIIQEMLDKLHITAQEQSSQSPQSSEATTQTIKLELEATEQQIDRTKNDKIGQKKTPIEQVQEISSIEKTAYIPPRYNFTVASSSENIDELNELGQLRENVSDDKQTNGLEKLRNQNYTDCEDNKSITLTALELDICNSYEQEDLNETQKQVHNNINVEKDETETVLQSQKELDKLSCEKDIKVEAQQIEIYDPGEEDSIRIQEINLTGDLPGTKFKLGELDISNPIENLIEEHEHGENQLNNNINNKPELYLELLGPCEALSSEGNQVEEPITEIPENIISPIQVPVRPPRKLSQADKLIQSLDESDPAELSQNSNVEDANELDSSGNFKLPKTEVVSKIDEEPPPRPPEPIFSTDSNYVPSQPPASFFELRSPQFKEFVEEDIPLPPRRKRHHKVPPVSRSSSDDVIPISRRHHRSSEPSIPQLTGQLVRLCATEADRSIKRLITYVINNIIRNTDGKQDLHVMILILLILIAGLILIGGERTVIHHHHWEFFNLPTD